MRNLTPKSSCNPIKPRWRQIGSMASCTVSYVLFHIVMENSSLFPTVKRKTLWNIAANPAWQLVSFMLRDRTQKSCKSSLVLTPSSSVFICSDPSLLLLCLFFIISFCLCTKNLVFILEQCQSSWPLYHSQRGNNPTPQNSLLPQTSPICAPSLV